MAVTQKSYVDNSSSVKAARKKLDQAEAKLADARKAKAGLPSGSGAQLASQIDKRIADAQKAVETATSEESQAKTKAQTYFEKNKESIVAKASAKEKATGETNIASAEAQLARMKEAGFDTTQLEQQITASKQNKTNQIKQDLEEGQTPGGMSVEQANKQIDALSKRSRELIFSMDNAERLNLAKTLTAAGYVTPELGGEFNDGLVANYKIALSNAKSWNNSNKALKGFEPLDFTGFLTYRTRLTGGEGGEGGEDGYTPQVSISNPSEAAGIINTEISQAFGRDATAAEISAITKALNKIESVNPLRRSGSKGGQYQYSGSVQPAEVVRQLIQDPSLVNLKGIDKKTASSLLKSVSKLGLADEFTKRKTDKTEIALDTIKETARSNGLPLTEAQLAKFSKRIAAGEGVDVMQKEIRNIVANTMPDSVKKLLDAGSDLEDVYAPYRQSMASILEVPLDKIDLNDPTLSRAITPQGNMPLFEFKRELRKDPRWQYTDNAKETVSTGLTQVLKDFGFMG